MVYTGSLVIFFALWAVVAIFIGLLHSWQMAKILLIIEGAVVGLIYATFLAMELVETVAKMRDTARAKRCWSKFYRGPGPKAFARKGEEVLVIAVPGVLHALRGVEGLRRRAAYEAGCYDGWAARNLRQEGEWASWPFRYRDRVRVWSFAAMHPEEVEEKLTAAGLQKLPTKEFLKLVQDWRAFLTYGFKLNPESNRGKDA